METGLRSETELEVLGGEGRPFLIRERSIGSGVEKEHSWAQLGDGLRWEGFMKKGLQKEGWLERVGSDLERQGRELFKSTRAQKNLS